MDTSLGAHTLRGQGESWAGNPAGVRAGCRAVSRKKGKRGNSVPAETGKRRDE